MGDSNVNKPIVIKIGKYTCKCIALNEPSEQAILRCRRVVTRIMNEYYESLELDEANGTKEA